MSESLSDRAQRIAEAAVVIEAAAREVVAAWDSGDSWRSAQARKGLRRALAHVDVARNGRSVDEAPSRGRSGA